MTSRRGLHSHARDKNTSRKHLGMNALLSQVKQKIGGCGWESNIRPKWCERHINVWEMTVIKQHKILSSAFQTTHDNTQVCAIWLDLWAQTQQTKSRHFSMCTSCCTRGGNLLKRQEILFRQLLPPFSWSNFKFKRSPFCVWRPWTCTVSEVHSGVGAAHGIAKMSIPESEWAPHWTTNHQNIFYKVLQQNQSRYIQ